MDLYGGGSISQMDRLRVCLYISRKTETERRSSLFAVRLPCFITSCFNITDRGIDARERNFFDIDIGREGKRAFWKEKREGKGKGKKREGEKEKQTRRETASRGIMNRDLLTSRRKGRFAGRTISNCAL